MNKTNFIGGMRGQFDSSKEDWANSYRLLINARSRENVIKPIRLPVEDTTLPAGLKQGIYTFDRYILAFVAGAAYYKDASAETWNTVPGFAMSATAPRIYVERIPASYTNFKRDGSDGALILASPTTQSPTAIICMDGVTQPWVVFPDGSARATKTWNEWSAADPEYVPIGKFPMFRNGKLYCVVADSAGRFNQIVGSVTGRPLDFVILVNNSGDKAGSAEHQYGARALAYHVSFEDVTAMRSLNALEGGFLVTTARGSYIVTADYTKLIAGEPLRYSNQPLFAVGALNPDAITDLNGDTAVIYQDGIRTFNGVAQSRWEGKNAPLIRNIQSILGANLQTYGATVQWDNYVGFALQTNYGGGVIWWDDTLANFVALDLYPGAARIKQFAAVNTPAARRLFFITEDDRVFEAFVGAYAEAAITLHDLPIEDAGTSLAVRSVVGNFRAQGGAGYWTASLLADGQLITATSKPIVASGTLTSAWRAIAPELVGNAHVSTLEVAATAAARNTLELRWTGGATLCAIGVEAAPGTQEIMPFELSAEEEPAEKFLFIGDDGTVNANRTAVHNAMKAERDVTAVIGAGDHIYESGTQAELDVVLEPYWGLYREFGRFYAVPGNHDLDTDAGAPFFQFVRQTPTRYSVVSFEHTDVFLFDTGLTTAGAQVNPDNSDGPTLATSTQAEWLVNALRSSTKRNKIVVWHHPAYTSSSNYGPGNADMQAVQRRAIDAGATAIINGHAHLYERIVSEIPQFIVGTGGRTPHSIGTRASGSQQALSTYGYLRVVCSPVRAVFEFVSADGIVLDKFVA